MQRFGTMSRVIGVALGVLIALAAFNFASAQQQPDHTFYGGDGTPGDTITAQVSHGDHYDTVGSATVAADGSWFIDVDSDVADEVVFSVNGEMATDERTVRGQGLTEVSNLTVAMVEEPACPDDGMMEDDSMMSDDDSMMEDDSMESDDDSMMSDDAMLDCPEEGDDDSMMEDDDTMMGDDEQMLDEDVGYPGTGTGGLAETGGISAGLIGLLIALAAAAVAGLGIRQLRNRA